MCSRYESTLPPPDCLISEKKLSKGSCEKRRGTHLRLVFPKTYSFIISYIEWHVRCRSPCNWCVMNIRPFCVRVRSGRDIIQFSQSENHLDITIHLSGLLKRMWVSFGIKSFLLNPVNSSKWRILTPYRLEIHLRLNFPVHITTSSRPMDSDQVIGSSCYVCMMMSDKHNWYIIYIYIIVTELFNCRSSQKWDRYIRRGSNPLMFSSEEILSLYRSRRDWTSSLNMVAARWTRNNSNDVGYRWASVSFLSNLRTVSCVK